MSTTNKTATANTEELALLAMKANAAGRVTIANYGQVYLDGMLVRSERIAKALRGY